MPSVAQLPCSGVDLFEGMLAKSFPHLVGAPEVADLKQHLEAGAAAATAALNSRKERERQEAEAARKAEEEAAAKAASEANADDKGTASAQLAEAAATPVEMDIDDLDLDDDTLQGPDPSNAEPAGDVDGSQLEQWRVVQRGTARKVAEQFGKLVAAKRAKTAGCG